MKIYLHDFNEQAFAIPDAREICQNTGAILYEHLIKVYLLKDIYPQPEFVTPHHLQEIQNWYNRCKVKLKGNKLPSRDNYIKWLYEFNLPRTKSLLSGLVREFKAEYPNLNKDLQELESFIFLCYLGKEVSSNKIFGICQYLTTEKSRLFTIDEVLKESVLELEDNPNIILSSDLNKR